MASSGTGRVSALAMVGLLLGCSAPDSQGDADGAAGGDGRGGGREEGALDAGSGGEQRGSDGGRPGPRLWATAYYAGWKQAALPPGEIDFTAFSHLIHFALVPKPDGGLDDVSNSVTAQNAAAAVKAAHAAGRPILISVGGAGSSAFKSATATASARATFIGNLVALVSARGYDGVDVDWEPLTASDGPQFVALCQELRVALRQKDPKLLLTAAVAGQPALIAKVASELDQFNVMTYDLSGTWPGWQVWHNSPVYSGSCVFASTGKPVPSADQVIGEHLKAGIPAAKLGVGIDFYGYVWTGGAGTSTGGASQPCQVYSSNPTVDDNVAYDTIMSKHYQAAAYRWDAAAEAAYLSFDAVGSSSDEFISYDDETSVAKKASYARTAGLGGVFVWELGGGHRASLPVGQRDPLLQALGKATRGPP